MSECKARVVIVGAAGHAKVIADIVRKNGDFVVGFLDDDVEKTGKPFLGSTVLGVSADYVKYAKDCCFIVALGVNEVRKRISSMIQGSFYTAIHPSAIIGPEVEIGEGSCVMAGAIINPYSKVGAHAIINTGAILEHDCVVGNYSHLCPHSTVCGESRIGNEVWIGAGCTVIHDMTVCDGVTLGAGAVVVRNLEEPGTYVGMPARKIK